MPSPLAVGLSVVVLVGAVLLALAPQRHSPGEPCSVLLGPLHQTRAPDALGGGEAGVARRFVHPAKDPSEHDAGSPLFKRWSFVSAANEDWFIAAAIVKFAYIADVFLYVVDLKRGGGGEDGAGFHEYSGRLPLGLGVQFSNSSVAGCTTWGSPKKSAKVGTRPWIQMCADAAVPAKGYIIRANVPTTTSSGAKSVRVRFELAVAPNEQDLVLLYPIHGDSSRIVYVHKAAGMKVVEDPERSWLQLDDALVPLKRAAAVLDWTKGRLAHRTFWRWVSLSTSSARVVRTPAHAQHLESPPDEQAQDEFLGINFSEEVYNANHSSSSSSSVLSAENFISLRGRTFPLHGELEIIVPANPRKDKWIIRSKRPTAEEDVDLVFSPLGARSDYTNLGVILSDFVQPYGKFDGRIVLHDAVESARYAVSIRNAVGVCEDHKAFW